jgi:LPXTG-motif cell wall-anchored protein
MTKFAKNMARMAPLFLTLSLAAVAGELNQKTVFTFSGPVEIPGQILPAGTYVFKLADSASNRHIIQVFNQGEDHVFGTFLAIPDYRLRPSEKPIITFHERPAGSPEAIKGWFYPGQHYGHEFVYPKVRARILAKLNHTPVPAMPVELTPDTAMPDLQLNSPPVIQLSIAPLFAERPSGQEVELADGFATEEASETVPDELPSTGSSLPLIALAGALSLGTAAALRFAVKTK